MKKKIVIQRVTGITLRIRELEKEIEELKSKNQNIDKALQLASWERNKLLDTCKGAHILITTSQCIGCPIISCTRNIFQNHKY